MPQLIDEIFSQILDTAVAISDPFEQAVFVIIHLPYLKPFEDVNKRVSRLAANILFIHHNLSPLSFMDVPEDLYISGLLGVYELNRIEHMRDVFVWTYERSCNRYQVVRHTLGEPDTFRLHYRKTLIDCVGEAVRQVGRGNANERLPAMHSAMAFCKYGHINQMVKLVSHQFQGIAGRPDIQRPLHQVDCIFLRKFPYLR